MRDAYTPTPAQLTATARACDVADHEAFQVDELCHRALCLRCFASTRPVSMLKVMGEHQNGDRAERADTQELPEAPATLETLNGKLNHLIIVVANVEMLCQRAVNASEEAKDIAGKSKTAALRASNSAIDSALNFQPISRRAGLGALFAGATVGGILVQLMLSGVVAAIISSCQHVH
jgi:hypothetical protein